MSERKLAIKFGTEGYQQAINEVRRVGAAFDESLKKAQERIDKANLAILQGRVMRSDTRVGEAEKARAKAAKDANQIIQNSYRELRVKSETDLNALRNQAISAYNAIRNSGVASARDIANANAGLRDRLEQLDAQLLKTSARSKGMGAALTQAVMEAKAAMRSADLTIQQGSNTGSKGLRRTGIDARERATFRVENATQDAFSTLGVTSEASIKRQRAQFTDAYNAIKVSGVASARDIANAERALDAQTKELNRTLKGAESGWQRMGAAGTDAVKGLLGGFAQAAGFTVVYGAVNAIGNAIQSALAFPLVAVKGWADFETQLKSIKVAADGADVSGLRKEIETLAPQIGKMPQDLATLATEFTRAGFSADQAAKLLRGVGYSSQATGEDLATVGEITRATIKQFQIAEKDYGTVSDVLVAGANKSAAGIGSLGEALSYVGPTAQLSNQDLQSTVTLLAALSDVGIQGSSAGTNLSEALQRIKIASAGASDEVVITTRGMKTASEAIDELGINFRQADGNLRPILDVLPELRKSLAKLPKEDQDVIMRVLFGQQGGRAISGLLVKTDAELQSLNKSIKNSGGAAETAGKELLSGFGGALQKLQASAEVGKLKFGEAIAPGLEAAARLLDVLLGKMSTTNGLFDEANATSKEFAAYLENNPALVEELNRQLEDLVRTTLKQASENAKIFLQYLKDNPKAIGEAIAQIEKMVRGLGGAVQFAQRLAWILQPVSYTLDKTYTGLVLIFEFLNKPLDPKSWIKSLAQLSPPSQSEVDQWTNFAKATGGGQGTASTEKSPAASQPKTLTMPDWLYKPIDPVNTIKKTVVETLKTAGSQVLPLSKKAEDPKKANKDGKDYVGIQGRTGFQPGNTSQEHVHFEGSLKALESLIVNINKKGLKVFAASGKEMKSAKDAEAHWDGKPGAHDLFVEGAPFNRSNVNVPIPNPFFGQSQVTSVQGSGRGGNAVVIKELATQEDVYLAHFKSLNLKVGDILSGETSPVGLFKAGNDAAKTEADRQRKILEDARKRSDERRSQQNEFEKQRLADQQQQEILAQQLNISKLPEGGQKQAAQIVLQATEKEQISARERLEIEQAINQLIEERRQKLEDQGAGLNTSGQDYTAQIEFLKQRKSQLEQNEFTEKAIIANQSRQEIKANTQKLREQVVEASEALAELKAQYADDTAENRQKAALKELTDQFDAQRKTLDETRDALFEQLQKKIALGSATDEEIKQLQVLQNLYESLAALRGRATNKVKGEFGFAERQRKLDDAATLGDIDGRIAGARAQQLENNGYPYGANQIREKDAIRQEIARYQQELLDIEAKIAKARQDLDNALAEGVSPGGLTELQNRIGMLDQLKLKAGELNQVNLDNIKNQFRDLGETVKGVAQDALGQFFDDIFTGTKSAEDAFKDMVKTIIKAIAQMVAKMLVARLISMIFGGFGGGKGAPGGGGGGSYFAAKGGLVKAFAGGGPVHGPGTGTSDDVPAWLSNNEFVLTAATVDNWGEDFLHSMNSGSPASVLPQINGNSSSSRNIVVNQSTTVITPQADSFRATEYQRSRDQAEMVRRAIGRG